MKAVASQDTAKQFFLSDTTSHAMTVLVLMFILLS